MSINQITQFQRYRQQCADKPVLWKKKQTDFSAQFSSVAQSCPTLCDPMNPSTPGLPVHHQHLEFTQTHVHRIGDAIQPSHPLSSPSLPAPNPSQYQSLLADANSCDIILPQWPNSKGLTSGSHNCLLLNNQLSQTGRS